MMDVIGLGKQVAKLFNNVIGLQDKLERTGFYKFLDEYHLEINREDCDHDDLIIWKQRKEDLMNTIFSELRKK